jgi:hypothetical protein
LVNLFVDASNKLNKYSENALENLLLEYLFKDKDRGSIENKVRKNLFKQKKWWKRHDMGDFPHEDWLRDTLKRVIFNIESKSFKDHADEYFGKKSGDEYDLWAKLDMKNFDSDFTIGNLKNPGKVDKIVGKTSYYTNKILDRQYKLRGDEREAIVEKFDISPKVSFMRQNKNVDVGILMIRDIKINKEDIFKDNNVNYKLEPSHKAPIIRTKDYEIEIDISTGAKILGRDTQLLEDTFWNDWKIKDIIKQAIDIFDPHINFEANIKVFVELDSSQVPIDNEYTFNYKYQITLDPITEIRDLAKDETQGVWNAAREAYLGRVKGRLEFLDMKIGITPKDEEE